MSATHEARARRLFAPNAALSPAERLDHLRSQLADAMDEENRVLLSDDFAMTNGSYQRAVNVTRAIRADIAEAELELAMSDPAYHRATRSMERHA